MSTGWRHTCCLNSANTTHALRRVEHAPSTLSIKKNQKNCKYNNPPHDPDNYTKYLYEGTKIPLNAKLMFCLFQG
jgi:hypothetical protein